MPVFQLEEVAAGAVIRPSEQPTQAGETDYYINLPPAYAAARCIDPEIRLRIKDRFGVYVFVTTLTEDGCRNNDAWLPAFDAWGSAEERASRVAFAHSKPIESALNGIETAWGRLTESPTGWSAATEAPVSRGTMYGTMKPAGTPGDLPLPPLLAGHTPR